MSLPIVPRFAGLVPLVSLMALPAGAKVLATGKPSADGLYGLKIEKANGAITSQCRLSVAENGQDPKSGAL